MSPIIVVFCVIFAFIVLALAIVSITILGAMRMRHGGLSQKDRSAFDEETRLIQQMHDDLSKMEARIESLETILMEDIGKDRK
jgi:phage shock protein B